MSKRLLGYVLLGLLAYALFMLIQFPATVLMDLVAKRAPGFTVQHAQGSLRYGSAKGIQLQGAQFDSLTWRLRFTPLLLGRLEYRFSLTDPGLHLEGNIATSLNRQIRLSDLKGGLPLAKLTALLNRPALPVNGQLESDAAQLQFSTEGRLRTAAGTIRLLDTRANLGRPLELGDFSLELSTKEQDILGNVKDTGGPLELIGTLTLTPEGSYRFIGQTAVRDETNRELRQALSIMGRPGGDGKWKLNFSGNL